MKRSKVDVSNELAREEARLAEIERTRAETKARVEELKLELETVTSPAFTWSTAGENGKGPLKAGDKIELFGSLFRGRPDVFPARFVSGRTKKSGYAPMCSNKWQPGICALRTGGKCGDCANQAFIPVSDQIILDHLQGRHVIGVYPLLQDETCWFLAVDFDKHSWQADVIAFAETCRATGVPVAVERSRSGHGAHAWFFFTAPVTASVARRMGCHLITETMNRRHEIGMDSYDRLFPNQDTMPRGGFGNLIALPLQQEARQHGNTVFVDREFEPYSDQWGFLASVSRIEPSTVETIAQEAVRTGQVVGVRFAEGLDDEELAAPWTRRPSGRKPMPHITSTLPDKVTAVLAQRLFIDKTGLPSALLNQLKRLAAFQNPEFYKKQKMRLSTALTPRVIACAEELPLYLALPRGCVQQVKALLAQYEVKLAVEDERHDGAPLNCKFNTELTPAQKDAVRMLLAHENGVFVGPPGFGKTVLGIHLLAQRARSTLILVHRKPLLAQWVAQLAMFLDVQEKAIGQAGGGKRKLNGNLDVAMIQSLVHKGKVDDLVANYGHVIVDECHHLPAVSFERVLSEVKARYVTGLTATPQRRDGHHPITEMQLGPVRYKIDAKTQVTRRPFEHKLVVRETPFRLTETDSDISIQEIYRALINDDARNARILDDVTAALKEGRTPILLTERKEHLAFFVEQLRHHVRHLVVLQGGMSAEKRRETADQLASTPDNAERLIVATGRYIGEGFDDAGLDTLFLAMPVSWKGTLIQYSGRLHRYCPGKTEVRIYDYVDLEVPALARMFEKRLSTYRAIGYERAGVHDKVPGD